MMKKTVLISIISLLALFIVFLVVMNVLNKNTFTYKNKAGDKYKVKLTIKDEKVTKARVTISFNGKTKQERKTTAEYSFNILKEQSDIYKNIKLSGKNISFDDTSHITLGRTVEQVKTYYEKSEGIYFDYKWN